MTTPDAIRQQSVAKFVPKAVAGSTNGCLLKDPYFMGDVLTAEVLTEDSQDAAAMAFRTVRMHLPDNSVHIVSQPHPGSVRTPIRPVLEKLLHDRAASALRPFAEPDHLLLLHVADTLGPITLVRMDASDIHRTVMATYHSDHHSIHVVVSELYADVRNLHLVDGGSQILVEETEKKPASSTGGSYARTGRIAAYEVANGKTAWVRTVPQLTHPDARIICASQSGTLVIGSPAEQHIQVVGETGVTNIRIPSDVSTRCSLVAP
jgi:hypothetical protein